MIITNASYDIIKENDPLKKIEMIARVCYKSEDNITEGSDIKMVNSLIARKHTAMLEHATIILNVSQNVYEHVKSRVQILQSFVLQKYDKETESYRINPKNKRLYLRFSETPFDNETRFLISGNIRAWYEYFNHPWEKIYEPLFDAVNSAIHNIFSKDSIAFYSAAECKDGFRGVNTFTNLISDINTLTSGERMIHENLSVKFTVDRGVTHEIVRMREASFAQESTRYCNYSKDKFGKEITVIKPCFKSWDEKRFILWQNACENAERRYFDLLDIGATPQEARDVLPTSVKSEIVVTANLIEWYHILNLRACDATGPAHPQMHEVMIPLLDDFKTTHSFAFDKLTTEKEV